MSMKRRERQTVPDRRTLIKDKDKEGVVMDFGQSGRSERLTDDGVNAVATVRGVGGLQQMPCSRVDNHVDEVALVGRVKVTQPSSFFPSHLLIILTDQTQDMGLALPHLCNNTK